MTESRKPLSDRSFAERRASASGDTQSRTCKCGRPFLPAYTEQLRCLRCRQLLLAQDGRRSDQEEIQEAVDSLLHSETDWQLVDPDHPGLLIWASDLAKLYREQTQPRPVRNNLARWR